MDITARVLFDEKFPKAIQEKAAEFKEVGGTYTFNIEGEGTWLIDLEDTPFIVEGPARKATGVTITVSAEDFKTMIADPQMGMVLYFDGKLKIQGDPLFATKLQNLFALAV